MLNPMNFTGLLLFLLVLLPQSFAQTEDSQPNSNFNVKKDLQDSFAYMFKGSYLQFKQPSSWALIGLGVVTVLPVYNTDKKVSARQTPPDKFTKVIGHEISNVFNFPIIPIGAYLYARSENNLHWKNFAQETLAATYLTLIETSLISRIHVHERPDSSNLTNFETSFRGDSSFPSGHVVGFSVLTFKTLQFFGPAPALVPAFLTYVTHKERIASRKHYPSDTVASFFLAALASEGVRAAAQHDTNHPFYRMIFEHKLKLAISPYDKDGWRGQLAFNY